MELLMFLLFFFFFIPVLGLHQLEDGPPSTIRPVLDQDLIQFDEELDSDSGMVMITGIHRKGNQDHHHHHHHNHDHHGHLKRRKMELDTVLRRTRRAATGRPERLWDYGVIPYEIESNFSGTYNFYLLYFFFLLNSQFKS